MEDFPLWGLLDAPNSKVSFYQKWAVQFVCSRVPHVERMRSIVLLHGCLESTPPLTNAAEEHCRFILVALWRSTKDWIRHGIS